MFLLFRFITCENQGIDLLKILSGEWKVLQYHINSQGLIRTSHQKYNLLISPKSNDQNSLTAILTDTKNIVLKNYHIKSRPENNNLQVGSTFLVYNKPNEIEKGKFIEDEESELFSFSLMIGSYGAVSSIGSIPNQSIDFSVVMFAPNDFEVLFLNSTNQINILRMWKIDENAMFKQLAQRLPLFLTIIAGFVIFRFSKKKVFQK